MATTPEQIEEYFKQLDWPFIRKEGNLWDSGYNGNNFRFRFFVRLTDNWLYVTWLFPVAIHDDCRANKNQARRDKAPPINHSHRSCTISPTKESLNAVTPIKPPKKPPLELR